MDKINVKPIDVVDNTTLPAVTMDQIPSEGDPLEINGEIYYVCEKDLGNDNGVQSIGVIPLVVKNPANVRNIQSYINCLSIANRRVSFRKGNNSCTFEDCDEMIVS